MPSADHGRRLSTPGAKESWTRGAPPVLRLTDDLRSVGPDLHRAVDEALEGGPRTLVIDMVVVDHVTSTTIAALLTVHERCSARGARVLLRRPSRRSLHTLRRTGLMARLHVEEAPRLTAVAGGAVPGTAS